MQELLLLLLLRLLLLQRMACCIRKPRFGAAEHDAAAADSMSAIWAESGLGRWAAGRGRSVAYRSSARFRERFKRETDAAGELDDSLVSSPSCPRRSRCCLAFLRQALWDPAFLPIG